MSMLETLIGTGVVRNDTKRLLPTGRPMFLRSRDVFEIIVALGTEATIVSIFHCVDLRAAEPRALTSLVLNRWPTEAELAELPDPYRPTIHLRALLSSREFRECLFRRICDSYPERQRNLFVRIPRCAGEHFLATIQPMHPIFPHEIGAWRPRDDNRFMPILGTFLGRFTLTRTIVAVQPTMAPFIQYSPSDTPDPAYAKSCMQWTVNSPPRRSADRLFTIIREPTSLILSEVNGIIDRLRQPPEADTTETAAWRKRFGAIFVTADPQGLKTAGREILRTLSMRNPMCHAIADGTAASALRAARHQDIEIASFNRYADWVKYTWDVEIQGPINVSTPHLTPADLSPNEIAHIRQLVDQDLLFYEAFLQVESQLDEMRYSVRGKEL